jgi:4-hydroxy-tetrahydrodipicolinate synthase
LAPARLDGMTDVPLVPVPPADVSPPGRVPPVPHVHVPLITPFDADDRVAVGPLKELARAVLRDGAAGIVALGTTGEPGGLDEAERAVVIEAVGRVCREQGARFTLGAGRGSTRQAAGELAALADLPVVPDAALVTVPPFTRPGESGVLAHFTALAAASPVPLIVYYVPYRTGQPLTARALAELAALPGVAGVKYAPGGIDAEAVALLGAAHGAGDPAQALPAGFEVLSGDDVFAPALLALGAAGGILASAHLATTRWVELAAGGTGGAAADPGLGHRLAALAAAVFREPNPAVVKAVLHAQGRIPTPDVRLPLLPASAEALAGALAGLRGVG